MIITILGCGASSGVPLIGCTCPVCASPNTKNHRSRPSILIHKGKTRLLVDTSPDLRQQALDNKISEIDAILITHAHADHVHGIDDVRSFNYHKNQSLPLYSNRETLDELICRFSYIFQPHDPEKPWYRPSLTPIEVHPQQQECVEVSDELSVQLFSQPHGEIQSIGLRVDGFAYSTDMNGINENSARFYEGLDVWVVDCLRISSSPTHANLEMTLGWIERFKPRRTVLTHMSHDFDYDRFRTQLPEGVEPAYDGMKIAL